MALSAGFTHIDTAEVYNTEESVGIAVQKYLSGPSKPVRDSLFIVTKFYNALEPGQTVKDRLAESLRKLQLDYVDLYLIHTPVSHLGKLKDIWKQMEAVQKEGLARNIGVSNFRVKDYEEFIADANTTPVCNQVRHRRYSRSGYKPLISLPLLPVDRVQPVPLERGRPHLYFSAAEWHPHNVIRRTVPPQQT